MPQTQTGGIASGAGRTVLPSTAITLPADDDFAAGSPAYGDNLLMYFSIEPSTADYGFGHLNDGYAGTLTPAGRKATNAAAVEGASESAQSSMGWAYRASFGEDVSVFGTFYANVLAADAGLSYIAGEHLNEWGVVARAQGGTETSYGTDSTRIVDLSCYIFRLVGIVAGDTVDVELARYNSGTETIVDTVTVSTGGAAAIDWLQPITLRLVLIQDTYECWIEDYISSGAAAGPTLLLSGTDSSELTGNGRCGFTMSGARAYASPDIDLADICESWGVTEGANQDALLFADEWVRHAPLQQQASASDTHSNTGRVLQSSFTYDQFSDATTVLARSSGALMWDPANTGVESKLFLSHRDANSGFYQRRSVDVFFGSGTHTQYGAGVLLRGDYGTTSGVPADPLVNIDDLPSIDGYLGYARITSSAAAWAVGVTHYVAGVATTIAELTGASSPPFPTGSSFTLEFIIQPVFTLAPNGDISTAHVQLRLFIDSTQQILVALVGSVVNNGIGTVEDRRSTRTQFGLGEGVHGGVEACTRTILFDAWDQGVLGNDLAAVSFSNEGTPTIVLNDILRQQYGVQVEYKRGTIDLAFASGHRFTAATESDGTNTLERRVFTFNAPTVIPSEHYALASFFDAMGGREGAFLYEDENAVQIPVCFEKDSLRQTKRGPNVYGTSFRLVELLNTT